MSPFTNRGTVLPICFPSAIAAGLKSQQGTALGDYIEVSFGPFDKRGHGLDEPAFNHLNIYVTSRMFWNPQQNLDTLLDEYRRLFYGPAAAEMREFLRFCEGNWQRMRTEAQPITEAGAKPTGPGGDRVELLIETPAHSYYQLVIGPTGLIEDADWQGGKRDPQWDAQAQVVTKIGKGFWTAEVRIPVPGADQLGDPLHEIAGRPPRAELPWYVNVIRERKGKGKTDRSTWVPADSGALRDPRTFGKWYVR